MFRPKGRNERSMKSAVNLLIKNVEEKVGEQNTIFYLQSAIKNTINSEQANKTPE